MTVSVYHTSGKGTVVGCVEYCDPVYARPGPGWHPPCGSRAFHRLASHRSMPSNRANSGQFQDMRSCGARNDLGG